MDAGTKIYDALLLLPIIVGRGPWPEAFFDHNARRMSQNMRLLQLHRTAAGALPRPLPPPQPGTCPAPLFYEVLAFDDGVSRENPKASQRRNDDEFLQ
jgi:hypothetical protein